MIEAYKKHDNLFSNVKKNAIGNIVIFSKNDAWKIQQDYHSVSANETNIWQHLYSKVIDVATQYGSMEFIKGIEKLKLCSKEYPNIHAISNRIKSMTDWEVVTVAGFLDEFLFPH